MSDQILGPLEFLNGKSKITIIIEGDGASIKVGGEGTAGRISVVDSKGKEVFRLQGDAANLSLGAEGLPGHLTLIDDKGEVAILAMNGTVVLGTKGTRGDILVQHAEDLRAVFFFNSFDAALTLGAMGHPGKLSLVDTEGRECFLTASAGDIVFGRAKGRSVNLVARHEDGSSVLTFTGSGAELEVGADGHPGKITVHGGHKPFEGFNGWFIVQDEEARNAFLVKGSAVRVGAEGNAGDLRIVNDQNREWLVLNIYRGFVLGGEGTEGRLQVRDSDNSDVLNFAGSEAELRVGANKHGGSVKILGGHDPSTDQSGKLVVQDNDGRDVFQVKGRELRLGAKGAGGLFSIDDGSGGASIYLKDSTLHLGKHVVLEDDNGRETLKFEGGTADLTVGGNGNAGTIKVLDSSGEERVKIIGHTGDIELMGADCAEEFDLLAEAGAEPATVMVIDAAGGKLRPCDEAYDRKVAGVISGGGTLSPGITLDKQGGFGRRPVALAGKVMCKVDARYAPIEIGDLLTTSPTTGHAMRVQDHAQAFGAVIGKALKPLKAGAGLIPILIALQ